MSHTPFFITLYGPTCAGKTTTAKLLMQKVPSAFNISYDKLKLLISDFSSEKYGHTGSIERILFASIEAAVKEGFSIVLEGENYTMKNYGAYEKLAEENNLQFVQVQIECPLDMAHARFNERLQSFKDRNMRTFTTTKEKFDERYGEYVKNKIPGVRTIDSSDLTPEEVVREVEGLIAQGTA